jgi:hypothetical protein
MTRVSSAKTAVLMDLGVWEEELRMARLEGFAIDAGNTLGKLTDVRLKPRGTAIFVVSCRIVARRVGSDAKPWIASVLALQCNKVPNVAFTMYRRHPPMHRERSAVLAVVNGFPLEVSPGSQVLTELIEHGGISFRALQQGRRLA